MSVGGFKLNHSGDNYLKSGCNLLNNLIEGWILCKGNSNFKVTDN